MLTKLSGIPSNITYNLLLGTVAGLCMTASFSLALNLLHGLYNVKRVFVKIGLGALLAAALVTFGGNLHTIYTLYPAYENEKPVPFWTLGGPLLSTIGQNSDNATPTVTNKYLNIVPSLSTFPNEYWYPNATRYIFNTIHEFPIYSWVVADLHGHVLDIPFVLLTIAMLYSLFTLTSIKDFSAIHAPYAKRMPQFLRKSIQYLSFYDFHLVVFIGFLLAVMYKTNGLKCIENGREKMINPAKIITIRLMIYSSGWVCKS